MGAKENLGNFKKLLDRELDKYLRQKIKEAKKISPYCAELLQNVSDITMRGGKRIRAAMLYFSYLAFGGKDKKKAMFAAMSMELMQTYLLAHDDIIDNDDLRRGGLSIHALYKQIGKERFSDKGNVGSFGMTAGILAGDLANAYSNKILYDSGFKLSDVAKAMRELNQTYKLEIYGEYLDVLSELRDDITKEDVILTHQLKTAPYTFDGPLKMGALLAGAEEKDLVELNKYTVPLGTAFQIQDDILGMFGSEEKLGKPVTSDLREGKRTLLILDALERGTQEQKDIINSNLGNRRVNMSGLKAVRKVIENTGSLKESQNLANTLVRKAVSHIEKMPLEKEGKDFLVGIAQYMVRRDY